MYTFYPRTPQRRKVVQQTCFSSQFCWFYHTWRRCLRCLCHGYQEVDYRRRFGRLWDNHCHGRAMSLRHHHHHLGRSTPSFLQQKQSLGKVIWTQMFPFNRSRNELVQVQGKEKGENGRYSLLKIAMFCQKWIHTRGSQVRKLLCSMMRCLSSLCTCAIHGTGRACAHIASP